VAVVGGGLGSQRINLAFVGIALQLLQAGLEVIHVTGSDHGDVVTEQIAAVLPAELRSLYQVKPFIDQHQMATLLKAADVVVSRSGATAMAELAALGKATILIPSPFLTGGHQLKNAEVFAAAQAAEVVDETLLVNKPQLFAEKIIEIATYAPQREILQKNILQFAKPNAANDAAQLILKAAGQGRVVS
jgi:UDP-N-acetylglucosamine--N-acetylmuramyl-(pentapeptide) pyrophosphoryl-undecaprenol N-acetylglucosamine transferase